MICTSVIVHQRANHKVALLGSHQPRQCGIATFTSDLSDALQSDRTCADSLVVAVNDVGRRYAYGSRVRFEISEDDNTSYHDAATFLNDNKFEALCLQHEYGIYGGKDGAHILALLRDLRMPIVTTLHTILADPTISQRLVMNELTRLSERLVVMSQHGIAMLRQVYQVPVDKIDFIPHGIDAVPFNGNSKALLGVDGQSVILTFGLLSPDKGIEYMIDALPAILSRFPKTVYMVLGATHPHVKECDGESYRNMLENRAERLGVGSQVQFHNRFVSRDELREFLSAADIYVTPYLKPEQITSGTLAYALGSGKAVISTPYWYAEELLAEGRGILVPWRDSGAIAENAIGLFESDSARHAMQQRAAAYGREMAWSSVAHRYVQSFELAVRAYKEQHRDASHERALARRPTELRDRETRSSAYDE
jgi:glycosyltransferase involved in cell wall biosynthesis